MLFEMCVMMGRGWVIPYQCGLVGVLVVASYDTQRHKLEVFLSRPPIHGIRGTYKSTHAALESDRKCEN